MSQVSRTEIDAAITLLDTLNPESGCRAQAGRIIRSLVNGYIQQALPVRSVDSNFTPEEMDCLKSNEKIGTIKLVRVRLGVGLKDAKDYVEKYGNKYLSPPKLQF